MTFFFGDFPNYWWLWWDNILNHLLTNQSIFPLLLYSLVQVCETFSRQTQDLRRASGRWSMPLRHWGEFLVVSHCFSNLISIDWYSPSFLFFSSVYFSPSTGSLSLSEGNKIRTGWVILVIFFLHSFFSSVSNSVHSNDSTINVNSNKQANKFAMVEIIKCWEYHVTCREGIRSTSTKRPLPSRQLNRLAVTRRLVNHPPLKTHKLQRMAWPKVRLSIFLSIVHQGTRF